MSGKHYDRPLRGPHAHPYLVSLRRLLRDLRQSPPSEMERRRTRALQQLAKDKGPSFAGIIAWALRERLEGVPHGPTRGRTLQSQCQRGHSMLPGSPHVAIDRHGRRCCGTCRRQRQLDAQLRKRNIQGTQLLTPTGSIR